MKSKVVFLFGVLFLSTLVCLPKLQAQDQDPPTIYFQVDFMKAKTGVEYVSLEKDIWKALHQERVKNGDIAAWYWYEVRFPYGHGVEYDYVTVTVYDDLAKLKEPIKDLEAAAKSVYPDMEISQLYEKTSSARDLVWGEMFTLIDEAVPGPSNTPAEFIAVNFMAVDEEKGAAYTKIERELIKPVQIARTEAGNLLDWLLFARLAPKGDDYEYQYITVDAFGSWENYGKKSFMEAWKKVHPDKDPESSHKKIVEIRTLKRKETWQLLDYVIKGDLAANE